MKRNTPLKRNPEKTREWQERSRRNSRLSRGGGKKSTAATRQPKRDWTDARAKVEREGVCRVGRCAHGLPLDAAHVIGRDRDQPQPCSRCGGSGEVITATRHVKYPDGRNTHARDTTPCWTCGGSGLEPVGFGKPTLYVNPDAVVPLCREHHRQYDKHEIDLLPVLHPHEQVRAVEDAGGIELARRRTCPSAYREADERGD